LNIFIIKCPHDTICPLIAIKKKCVFRAAYYPVHLKETKKPEEQRHEPYSYVVIKKEERSNKSKPWPRIVIEDPNRRSAAFHTYLCTRFGNLDHYVATQERNK
jgi:ribosomal protein RSM22 (predicted rRNA methylase)